MTPGCVLSPRMTADAACATSTVHRQSLIVWAHRLVLLLVGAALSSMGTARAESNAPATVDFQFDNVAAEQNGIRSLHVSAGFPARSELILSGKLLKATADDGTDLLPQDKAQWELISQPRTLHLFRDRMRNNVTIPLRTFDSVRVRALREIAGTFTCLVGEWKEIDLGLTVFVAGQAGKQHGAKIESVKPWPLTGGTQTLSLFLDVPLSASDQFVFTDAGGQALPCRMMQQEAAPGGSITTFLLEKGSFPQAGKIKARILEAKPVEMPFKFTQFSLKAAR
jgi:hypothetical protein